VEIKALCGVDHVENSHTPAQVRPQTTAELVRKIALALLGKLRCSLRSPLRSVWLFSTGTHLAQSLYFKFDCMYHADSRHDFINNIVLGIYYKLKFKYKNEF
jgi:hypothetical protein